ncbi:MAG: cytochrome-c peroxidase [Archangium sp.]|nr:cytochrome-c peroxidase [Archangium sp.]
MKRIALLALCGVACRTAAPAPTPVAEDVLAQPRALPAAPKGLPAVISPEADPLTAAKADLGWRLFFDPKLSKDGSKACAGCHLPERAYTTPNATDAKVGGAPNKRNSPSVANLAFFANYYWDGRAPTLEVVSNAAWKGQLGADPVVVSKSLNADATYRARFIRAFGEPASAENVPRALAAFFRALTTGDSPYDRFVAGDTSALSAQQQQGLRVFTSSGCGTCHVPPLFMDTGFHNVGIGDDPGRRDATKEERDTGAFKTPSLRNVALTAPYFHDGSAKTLDDAIALMAKGGNANPHLDDGLKPVSLAPADAAALKAFLEGLTGPVSYPSAPPP